MKLKSKKIIKNGLVIIAIVAFAQCTSDNSKSINKVLTDSTNIQVINDSTPIKKIIDEKSTINQEWYTSTLDTTIVDTLRSLDNNLIIESINDSLYNNYYNNSNKTIVISNPYDSYRYEWKTLESKLIENTTELVYRVQDTLVLELDTTSVKLIDCRVGCEVEYYFHYVQFIEQIDCHVVYVNVEGGGLTLYSAKTGKESFYAYDKIFCNNSFTQMISCQVEPDYLNGGWINYFKWVDTSDELSILFSFDPNPNYDCNQISGFKDPIWISDNSLVCKYVIIKYRSNNEFDEKFCFVKFSLEKPKHNC